MAENSGTPPRHSVSVAGAVIDDEGRFLAIRRQDNGHWELPGGVLELDETPEQGVIREVLEETGVTVEPDQLTGVYKNMTRGIIALVFRCKPVAGEPHPTEEASEVAWMTLGDIIVTMDEAYAIRLIDAAPPVNDGRARIRTHDGVNLVRQ
jgi:8-oxo-dGTP diphosphatase